MTVSTSPTVSRLNTRRRSSAPSTRPQVPRDMVKPEFSDKVYNSAILIEDEADIYLQGCLRPEFSELPPCLSPRRKSRIRSLISTWASASSTSIVTMRSPEAARAGSGRTQSMPPSSKKSMS